MASDDPAPGKEDRPELRAWKLVEDDSEHVAIELIGRTWEELEVFEAHGVLHFPDRVWIRSKSGKFQERKVAIRVPREYELRQARIEARRIAAEEGLDPKLDPDRFDDLDNICILHLAVRMPDAPHEPIFGSPTELDRAWDKPVWAQLLAKLDAYRQLVDPRPTQASEAQLLAVISAVAKERAIRPLLVFDGGTQSDLVVAMACLAVILLQSNSSSGSSESSTQGWSPPKR